VTSLRLILRSLVHHWRGNLAVAGGTAVASAVLVGALAVGDSVRATLAAQARWRLGNAAGLALPGGRAVRAALADDLTAAAGDGQLLVAPLWVLPASASTPEESARANDVQVVGCDERLFRLAPGSPIDAPGPGEVYLNAPLAARLGTSPGDEVLLVVPTPSLLPRDAPQADASDASAALPFTVARIVGPEQFSRFSLAGGAIQPFTAMVNLDFLAERLDRPGRANALLAGRPGGYARPRDSHATVDTLNRAMGDCVTAEDLRLEARPIDGLGQIELRSGRIFLDGPIVAAANRARPGGQGVLTWLVNDLAVGERRCPYSTVAAVEPGGIFEAVIPADLADDEIVINDWLANDLHARPGEPLTMRFFVLEGSELVERQASFRIRSVVALDGPAGDRTLLPDWPGIADEPNCADWEAGIPIDYDRIRPVDEAYWDAHRGTPKAFVTLSAGRRLWANRFGELTALRFDQSAGPPEQLLGDVMDRIDPAEMGLTFTDIRSRARAGVNEALDFGGLFLGLSMFLIVAAVLLTGLMVALAVEVRSGEIGLLRAVGFGPGLTRRVLLGELAAVAGLGSVAGAGLGLAWTAAIVALLRSGWAGAVASWPIVLHASVGSMATGSAGSFLAAMLAGRLALGRACRARPRDLLARRSSPAHRPARRVGLVRGASALAVAAGAAVMLAFAGRQDQAAAGAFFGAGAMLLAGLLGGAWCVLARPIRNVSLGRWALVRRGLSRRPGRAVLSLAALAGGVFVVVSVNLFRIDPSADSGRAGGAGGFALYAESSLPVYDDLSTPAGRRAFGLDESLFADVSIVPLRLASGDDASCLNLGRAQQPALLGVDPDQLARRGAFAFVRGPGWAVLREPMRLVADEPTLTWGLGKGPGDSVTVADGAARPRSVVVGGVIGSSMLQGRLIVSAETFLSLYPESAGWRVFLIDCPAGQADAIAAALSKAGADAGLAIEPAEARLARFAAVQNTYLDIFSLLGGLGVLVGSAGFGIVVLRNALARRGELAMLRAVGFSRRAVWSLLLGEQAVLAGAGLAVGLGASAGAVGPLARAVPASLGWALAAVVGAALAVAVASAALAGRAAMAGELLDALRDE
jgi:ABC-type lipoprotein release transport system permease subunit